MGKHRGATHDDMLVLWHQAVFEAHRAHVINAPARMGFALMNDKSQHVYGNIEHYARASMTPRRRCEGWFGRFCLVKRLVRHAPFGFASCGLRRSVSTRRDAGRRASFHLFLGYRPTRRAALLQCHARDPVRSVRGGLGHRPSLSVSHSTIYSTLYFDHARLSAATFSPPHYLHSFRSRARSPALRDVRLHLPSEPTEYTAPEYDFFVASTSVHTPCISVPSYLRTIYHFRLKGKGQRDKSDQLTCWLHDSQLRVVLLHVYTLLFILKCLLPCLIRVSSLRHRSFIRSSNVNFKGN